MRRPVERWAVCFVLVTSFLRILPTILSLPLVLFLSTPPPFSGSHPRARATVPFSSLFIISRRKLHLATVQLFPFISFVMHRRHEIDINSSTIPAFSSNRPFARLSIALAYPFFRESVSAHNGKWPIKEARRGKRFKFGTIAGFAVVPESVC